MSGLVERNEIYTCSTCEMIFRYKSTKRKHEQTCSRTCKICERELLNSKTRKNHEIKCAKRCTCNYQETFQCSNCKKKFRFKSIQIDHEKDCTIKCKYCTQLFTDLISRAEHQRSHAPNGKPSEKHPCRNCDWIFLSQHDRNVHEKTCCLTCKVCKTELADQSTRAGHETVCFSMYLNTYCSIQVQHEKSCAISKRSRTYPCGLCKQIFCRTQNNAVTHTSVPINTSPKNPMQQVFRCTETSNSNRGQLFTLYALQNMNTVVPKEVTVVRPSYLRDTQQQISTNDVPNVTQCLPDMKLQITKSPSADNKTITSETKEENINEEKFQQTCSFCNLRSVRLSTSDVPDISYSKDCSVCLEALESYFMSNKKKLVEANRMASKRMKTLLKSETNPEVKCGVDGNVSVSVSESNGPLTSKTGSENTSVSDNSASVKTAVSGSTGNELVAKTSNTGRTDVTPEQLLFSYRMEDGSVYVTVISLNTDRDPSQTKCNYDLDRILPDPGNDEKPDILKIKVEPGVGLSQDVSGLSVTDYDPTKVIKMEM